ncbi:MAG TPA: hypothetical protein VGL86_27935 [Polyangia bacterium]|jgi:hypothetical protein
MVELYHLLPALGIAADGDAYDGYWWIMLAAVVFALVLPVIYLAGRHGGQPLHR